MKDDPVYLCGLYEAKFRILRRILSRKIGSGRYVSDDDRLMADVLEMPVPEAELPEPRPLDFPKDEEIAF